MKNFLVFSFVLFLGIGRYHSQTVYITDSGKKYHAKNCSMVKTGKKGIKLLDAKKKGYEACKICKIEDLIAAEEKEKQEKAKKKP